MDYWAQHLPHCKPWARVCHLRALFSSCKREDSLSSVVCHSVGSDQMVCLRTSLHTCASHTQMVKNGLVRWRLPQWVMALVGKPNNLPLLTRPIHCTAVNKDSFRSLGRCQDGQNIWRSEETAGAGSPFHYGFQGANRGLPTSAITHQASQHLTSPLYKICV